MNGLLTTSQAAEIINVKRATIAKWLNDGTLAGYRINGRWRIKHEEIDRLLEKAEIKRSVNQ